MTNHNIIVLLSSIGALNGIVFAIVLFLKKKRKTPDNYILGLLILAISLRVGKSVLKIFFDAPQPVIHLGLFSFMSIGPLIFFYFKSLFRNNFKFIKKDIFHLIPMILFIASCFIFPQNSSFFILRYYFIIFYLLGYLIISWMQFLKKLKEPQKKSQKFISKWFRNLLIGISLVWVSYYLSITISGFFYLVGPVLYSLIFYIMIFWIFNQKDIQQFQDGKKYQRSTLSEEDADQYYEKLLIIMKDNKLYLNPDLTMAELAKKISILPLHLSQIINEKGEQNFADFLNSYRLNEAKKKLSAKKYEHITIACIALESGFNSISSFNTAFKKQNNCTPSKFRSRLI